MEPENPDVRLSQIATLWSLVRRANHGQVDEVQAAREQLVERYAGAAHRYLRKLLQDVDAANEVFQEFVLKLVAGKLRGADPERGRFRNFVKGTLYHLVADYRNRQRQWPRPLPADNTALAAEPDEQESDRAFVESWCDELLARAWAALEAVQAATGQRYYEVLRFRADHPQVRSPEMAEQLTVQLGRTFTPQGVRQILHRAREKFAEFLLDEVSQSLENSDPGLLEQELVELGLFKYCRPALEKRSNRETE